MSADVSPNIVEDGLVLALDASDPKSYPGSGTTWFDRSGNGNNGTLVNGVGYNSANRGSLTFDGADDYVACSGSIVTTQATFIVWMRRNGNQNAFDGIIISRSGSNVNGINFISNGTNLGYIWNGAVNTYSWNSGLVPSNLQWVMYAVSITPTNAIAYLCETSGITSATNNVTHGNTTINSIQIGRDSFSVRLFNGNIAVAQIYNRALSASEIEQNFNATRSRFNI
jgi:hypothetical protein